MYNVSYGLSMSIIGLFDFICTLSCKLFLYRPYSPNIRWFFIHSMTNGLITYYTSPIVLKCLKDPNQCYLKEWEPESYSAFWLCVSLHTYHSLFFKLTLGEIKHHVIMCLICGFFTYYKRTLLSTVGLFYVSGLPGFIDYFLLLLVNIDFIESRNQKKVYIILSNWIRCPGCSYVAILGIPEILHYFHVEDYTSFFALYISNILFFSNGTIYNYMTIRDYYLKKWAY